jgi:hypothetical protein
MDSFASMLPRLTVAAQVCISNACEETNLVVISNDHNSHEYVCVTDPIFYLQVKNKP